MDIVQLLIPADSVHVGVKAVAGVEAVALEGQALPFGQGVDHLAHGSLYRRNIKGHRPFHAIEVVIEAGVSVYKEGCGDPAKVQRQLQVLLKAALDKFNGPLHVVTIQGRPVALGNDALVHGVSSSLV